MRKERQNSSSITGTSSAAPIQRTTTSGQSTWPDASSGRKLAAGVPMVIQGASSEIQHTKTATPTRPARAASRASGRICDVSSP
jgi:hypothetical protein